MEEKRPMISTKSEYESSPEESAEELEDCPRACWPRTAVFGLSAALAAEVCLRNGAEYIRLGGFSAEWVWAEDVCSPETRVVWRMWEGVLGNSWDVYSRGVSGGGACQATFARKKLYLCDPGRSRYVIANKCGGVGRVSTSNCCRERSGEFPSHRQSPHSRILIRHSGLVVRRRVVRGRVEAVLPRGAPLRNKPVSEKSRTSSLRTKTTMGGFYPMPRWDRTHCFWFRIFSFCAW